MVGYIHDSARHRRSGTTMQKMPGRGSLSKANAVRKVLPGFPAKPFERLEDVEAYLDGDRIACLLCGKSYKTVLIHVAKIHQMDEPTYRTRFNIPSKYVLAGKATVERLRANYRELDEDHPVRIGIRKGDGIRRPRGSYRRPVPLTGDSWKVGIDRMNSQPNRPSMKERRAKGGPGGTGRTWAPDEHDWHLEQARLHEFYRDITPPAGRISWSGFKKRYQADPELFKAFRAARAAGKADRQLQREQAHEERRRIERIRLAQPRPHRRIYDRSKADEIITRMAERAMTLAEATAGDDMPPERWFRQRLRDDADLRRRYLATVEALPFAVQARMQMLGARFGEAVRKLRGSGQSRLSDASIADRLGVTAMTVNNRRRELGIH